MVVSTFTIMKKEANAAQAIKIGDYIQFGSYYDEPILWRIINIDEDGDPLLFSEFILCLKAFDAKGSYHQHHIRKKEGSNEWENSNISQWLNSSDEIINWTQNPPSADNVCNKLLPYDKEKGFLADGNFTEEERNIIKPITHKVLLTDIDKEKRDGGIERHGHSYDISDVVQNYDQAYYKNVTDKVFFLSVKEIKEYVYDRGWIYKAKLTPKAVKSIQSYDYFSYITTGIYWKYYLRTPSVFTEKGRSISDTGLVIFNNASFSEDGVRPALSLNMKTVALESGSGSSKSPYIIGGGSDKPIPVVKSELEKAKEYNLLTEKLSSNYKQNISREEFCELVIKLYEALSGKKAELPKNNKFTDTSNTEILKANHLGIVNGVSEDKFKPNNYVTREEMSLMFYNLLGVLEIKTNTTMDYVYFRDEKEISSWAKRSIQLLNKLDIIRGVGNDNINPKGKATREQGIALVIRIYELYK